MVGRMSCSGQVEVKDCQGLHHGFMGLILARSRFPLHHTFFGFQATGTRS